MFYPYRERRLVTRSAPDDGLFIGSVRLANARAVAREVAEVAYLPWAVLSVETACTHKRLNARHIHHSSLRYHGYKPHVEWRDARPVPTEGCHE